MLFYIEQDQFATGFNSCGTRPLNLTALREIVSRKWLEAPQVNNPCLQTAEKEQAVFTTKKINNAANSKNMQKITIKMQFKVCKNRWHHWRCL